MNGILYFSATGNSLYIAQKAREALGGTIKYIPVYDGDGSEFERIVIVTPVYSYGMPTFVCDLLTRLDKATPIIVIQNYGGMVGGANYLMYEYCLRAGLDIKAVYVMKMPENFTTVFTVPKFYIKRTLKKADGRIAAILDKIKSGRFELPKKRRTKEKTYLKNRANWHLIGERFSVNQDCIRCGKCVDICPAENISLRDGKIIFADRCVACLGCYHRCPQKAIVYLGKKKKDRYINPHIDENDIGKDL